MNAQVNNEGGFDELYDLLEERADDLDDSGSDFSESSATTASIDPHTQILEDLTSNLNCLTLEAETILSRQPRSTQLGLSFETKRLFKQYEQYGSMARLKVGVQRFLRLGDEKGRLRIKDETKKDDNDFDSMTLRRSQPPGPAHYGEAFMINYTADDDKPKFNANTDFITRPIKDPFNIDPDAYIHHPLRIIDPASIPYITTLPWDPIATKISWPARLRWPRGMLSSINKILSIVDQESRVRLFHHVTKWGPSPVFRAGIAEHVKAQYRTLFETAEEHYLGMTPETRSFLRDVYFKRQHLNTAERRLLALACRVNEESVTVFWEDMAESLRGYEAMRTFMAAREIEKNREAKKKDNEEKQWREQKRREEVRRETDARFYALQASQQGDPNALIYFQMGGGVVRKVDGRGLDVVTTLAEENTMSAGMSVANRKRFDPDFQDGPDF